MSGSNPGSLITIDKTTGAGTLVGDMATVVGNSELNTFGSGLAFSPAGTLFLAGTGSTGILHTIDPNTGAAMPGATLTGANDSIAALAFDEGGTLLGSDLENTSPRPSALVAIDTATGAVAARGPLPNGTDVLAFEFLAEPDPSGLPGRMVGAGRIVADGKTADYAERLGCRIPPTLRRSSR